MFMTKPVLHIVSSLTFLLLLVVVVSFINFGNTSSLMLILLSATIGPFMGLDYPFSTTFKAAYILGLLLCGIGFLYGVKSRKHIFGQCIAVASTVGWVCLGLVGLGTGT